LIEETKQPKLLLARTLLLETLWATACADGVVTAEEVAALKLAYQVDKPAAAFGMWHCGC